MNNSKEHKDRERIAKQIANDLFHKKYRALEIDKVKEGVALETL